MWYINYKDPVSSSINRLSNKVESIKGNGEVLVTGKTGQFGRITEIQRKIVSRRICSLAFESS
jgi:hypothetical protein